ncbi:IclR family transcriptional regulator [Alicyclobacillus sp. ALC3]|uniref:IclR family transcriptional regulator n=1 Tax=Alicyclobacillus sp. ALC3 TaxID=2796143 RepID=UPI002377E3BB|nr:IclR family transcriptional regulator [Alicyclobacillus sp. ALC3]WDL95674.1 IclR family transcriptional regulator [Alicyclobacillus sp. ALC3]
MRNLNVEVNRSVERAVLVLNAFGFDQSRLTIDDVVSKTGLPKTTVYRILWTLERNGLVHFDERYAHYRLGFKLLEYGGIVLQNLDVLREAEPFLLELHDELDCTVILAERQADTLQYLIRLESDDDFQPHSYVGKRRFLHYGIIGRTILAHLPASDATQVVGRFPLEQSTPDTIVEEDAFYAQLHEIRIQGYGIDVGGTFHGFTGIAVPLFGPTQKVIGAIGLAAPSYRFNETEVLDRTVSLARQAANQISRRMGYVNKD